MKDNLKIIKIFAVLLLFIIVFCFISVIETTYTRNVTVTQVSDTMITVRDEHDHNWTFYGDGYFVGQELTLVMNTNNTNSNIYDDLIEQVLTK